MHSTNPFEDYQIIRLSDYLVCMRSCGSHALQHSCTCDYKVPLVNLAIIISILTDSDSCSSKSTCIYVLIIIVIAIGNVLMMLRMGQTGMWCCHGFGLHPALVNFNIIVRCDWLLR